jgi:hypothetical protein
MRIILNWTFKNKMRECTLDSSVSGWGQVGGLANIVMGDQCIQFVIPTNIIVAFIN